MTRNGLQRNETGKHERAITALIAGATMQAAADAAGVDRTTLWRWMREDAAFITEYNQARADHRDAVQAGLRSLASDALAVVRGILQSDETPPALRLRAAMAVLDAAVADKPGPVDYAEIQGDLRERETCRLLGA